MAESLRERLELQVRDCGPLAVAVSGGVDSLTLAVLAHRSGADARMMHATSPAVPREATERVQDWAQREGWPLDIVDAGEFEDPRYRSNPVNRCFFCKQNLYQTLRAITQRQIVSGANLDDLREYRPGLDAARELSVRHPYIEAGVDKNAVRRLAADLGLGAVAELPASPCLSSRVETGIRIEASTLAFIHATEQLLSARLRPGVVRCRVRAAGVVIELDARTLERLGPSERGALSEHIQALSRGAITAIRFAAYRNGSAFLTTSLMGTPA